ncbi:hypothetical protein M8J76_002145 [Diaphorina citri]|nr:hypothetical protein M8J75_015781 [Diaphorina citri]KAI5748812.1 hypothetical protein M8J76_002145 [Diaphorina citri]
MSFCSEYVLEEIQNCYNISKCLPSSKEGFIAKKIRKLVKIVKPLLKKFNSSPKPSTWDQTEADNKCNESKEVYDDQNAYNEHLEEQYDNHVNEMLEQQREMQQDIRVIAMLPDGRSFAIPFSMLPWGADYDICIRDDVYTITKDQIPQVQVA